MPIRITDIPPLQPTRLNQAEMDPRVAAAPGVALEGLAKDIASVSKPFADIANRLQDVKNATTLMDLRTRLETGAAEFKHRLAADPGNPRNMQEAAKVAKGMAAMLEAPGVPPEVRDQLRPLQQHMAHRVNVDVAEHAGMHVTAGGRKVFHQRMALAVDDPEDDAAIDREADAAKAAKLAPAEEVEAARAKAKVLRSDNKVKTEIENDAGGWIARNQNPNREAADFDEVKHANRMRTARELHREKTAVTFEKVRNDIITGTVTTPEEIDGRTARLNAAVGVQLKEVLGLRLNHAEAARLRSPEGQKELAGRVSSGLLRYTIDAEDYDKGFTAIAGDIGKLLDGPVKEQFQKELASAREGKQREIRTHADYYLKAMDDEWEHHGFGRRKVSAPETGPPDLAEAARIADENKMAERRYGEAKSKFIQWLALNPTVKEDVMRKKAFDLMKVHVREQASGTVIGQPPAQDG